MRNIQQIIETLFCDWILLIRSKCLLKKNTRVVLNVKLLAFITYFNWLILWSFHFDNFYQTSRIIKSTRLWWCCDTFDNLKVAIICILVHIWIFYGFCLFKQNANYILLIHNEYWVFSINQWRLTLNYVIMKDTNLWFYFLICWRLKEDCWNQYYTKRFSLM